MKIDGNAATAASVTGVRSEVSQQPVNTAALTPLPDDIFQPPIKKPHPDTFPDIAYQFGLNRMGKEDLTGEAARQEERAAKALAQKPPDLRTYMDAKEKVGAVHGEQKQRALEQLGYQLGLGKKSDPELEKELAKAEAELSRVMKNPIASEADRERARAHLDAVLEELDRRD